MSSKLEETQGLRYFIVFYDGQLKDGSLTKGNIALTETGFINRIEVTEYIKSKSNYGLSLSGVSISGFKEVNKSDFETWYKQKDPDGE